VVEYRCTGPGQIGAPASETCGRAKLIAGPRGRRDAAETLPKAPLQRILTGEVVDTHRRPQGIAGLTRLALLRGDEHHALAGTRAVDGGRCRSLQDLHRLDVVGVDISRAILLGSAFVLTGSQALDQIEVGGGEARVVDGHAVDHKERLRLARAG
jgi:hypothetical protein